MAATAGAAHARAVGRAGRACSYLLRQAGLTGNARSLQSPCLRLALQGASVQQDVSAADTPAVRPGASCVANARDSLRLRAR